MASIATKYLVALLRTCAKRRDLDRGIELHAEILSKGLLEQNIFIGNTLINMYAKCGAIVKAQQVFDELPVPDVVSWTTLIAGHCENTNAQEALHCFVHMQQNGLVPDAVTFYCILEACGSVGAADIGEAIHSEILRRRLLDNDTMLGTALVDMYAKCGEMEKAQEVFDELPARDVVAWTALISGYCEQGHSAIGFDCFEEMSHEGICPDAMTLACILKACGSMKAFEKGQRVHAEIVKLEYLEKDNVLASALVDMYGKCEALEKAQQVFNELQVRDRVSWTSLILGYSESSHGQEALQCFEEMQNEGIPPDAVAFACVLKACGSIRAVDQGRRLHAEILKNMVLTENTVLGCALLDMYAKCNELGKAQQVFDELFKKDLLLWNILIAAYLQEGLGEETLGCIERMKSDGITPDGVTFSCILRACGTLRMVEKGKETHTEIVRLGLLESNAVLGNALLDMYTKCCMPAEAEQVFNGLPTRDVVSWNTLIAGHFEGGRAEQALECFEWMQHEGISPDALTYSYILKACGSMNATDIGTEIHAEMVRNGLVENGTVLGSTLLDMYAKCGALDKAQQVFDELKVRDVILWTSLMSGYCEHGQNEKALECFEKMRMENLSPDAITFACMLKACGCTVAMERGKEIHAEIITKGLLEDSSILGNALVDMYAKCGAVARAEEVFDELQTRDLISWNAMVIGHAQLGHNEEAFNCYMRMKQEGFHPDIVTFCGILKAFGCIEAGARGQELHKETAKKGLLGTCTLLRSCVASMHVHYGALTKKQQLLGVLETWLPS